jgi:hypothetical protein
VFHGPSSQLDLGRSWADGVTGVQIAADAARITLLSAMTALDRPRARGFTKLVLIGINSLIRSRLCLELEGETLVNMAGQSVRANLTVNASIRSVNRGRWHRSTGFALGLCSASLTS